MSLLGLVVIIGAINFFIIGRNSRIAMDRANAAMNRADEAYFRIHMVTGHPAVAIV